MKRLIATFSLLLTMIAGASAQNDAMYVYRNDGVINAFFKEEVDSMVYTHYDADSLYHSDWQAQLIYTSDSVYYIPLDVIDSISFVTPETKYASGVVKLDELIPYLKSADGMTLSFENSLPSYLKPRIGDILLYENFDNPLFSQGFAGRVSSVDENIFSCDSVDLSDVYEQLFCFGLFTVVEDPQPQSGASKFRLVRKKAAGHVSSSIGLKGTVGSMNSLYLSLDGTLNFDVRVITKITPLDPPYIDVSLTPSFTAALTGGIKGKFSNNVLEKKVKVFGVPIPDTPFYIYVSSGPVIEPSLEASASVSTDVNFGFRLGLRYENGSWHPYGENVSRGFSAPEISGNIDGSVFTGIATEVGISSYGEIMKFYMEKELGVELSANLNTDLLNSNKYEELSKAKVDLDFVGSISANASLKLSKMIKLSGSFNLFSVDVGINTWKLLPTFSTPKVSDTTVSSAKVTVAPSENLLFPVSIGIGLMNEDNDLKECKYLSPDYRLQKDCNSGQYSYQFSKLNHSQEYIACPMVKWNGIDLIASPDKHFTLEPFEVQITSFKQIGLHYSPGEYYNDGRYYDYKYDVAITVEIESLDGVSDWGYVYRDPYGNIKHISLMQYGTSYTDTRYAYYRNEAKSTVCLYGYVKYQGDTEYYYNEPQEYSLEYSVCLCPDDHHPHAIDLGLPSGTKWACCNVGASSPEQYGGYYAWGETSEKSYYRWTTYAYWSDVNGDGHVQAYEFSNIGTDIAGTKYDVAHVRMGGSWRMPSSAQLDELATNCYLSSQWTQQNGVNGVLVTGPNGGQIFLPASGARTNDGLDNAGSDGYYWSSSLFSSYDDLADCLLFRSSGWYWFSSRSYGLSVRAVCP